MRRTRPWMVQVIEENGKSNRKEIVYPIFLECCEKCEDPMWKDIFMNSAHGKFPKGFVYKDGALIHKIKSRTFRLEIPKEVDDALEEVRTFFQQKGGIFSKRDYKNNHNECSIESSSSRSNYTWNEIRRRRLRDFVYNQFVEDETKKYNLNKKEKRQLQSQIKYLTVLDIPSTEVVLKEGKIESIHCLEFDINERQYNLKPYIFNTKVVEDVKKPEEKLSKNYMTYWIMFLKNYERTTGVSQTPRSGASSIITGE